MPTSQWSQIGTIVDAIVRLDPASVLDVGVGNGKWGFLAREYLELWDGREDHRTRTRRIEGVEAYEPYLTGVHDLVYDAIHRGEALDVLPEFSDQQFDLALLIDVPEHMSREDGTRLIEEATRVAKVAIASVPRRFVAREDWGGNKYEQHVTPWTRADLRGVGARTFLLNPASHIAVFSRFGTPACLTGGTRIERAARLWLRGKLY